MNYLIKYIYLIQFFLFVVSILCFAQNIETMNNEGNLEQLFEISDQSAYSETQIEYIEFRRNNKLNLWEANVSDLMQFPNFDLLISEKIIKYVQKYPQNSLAKLSKELELNGNQIIILEYCCYIQQIIEPTIFDFYSRTKTNITTDKIYGFEENKFQGSKLEHTSKTFIHYNAYSAGLVFDKDAGELSNFDFLSGYLKYEKKNISVLVGDYYYEFGMGNILWRDFPENKSADVISPAFKINNGVKPYRSTMDNSYFRGIAVDYNLKFGQSKLKFGLFASLVPKAGTFDSVNYIITSVYNTGLYRTETEISKKSNFDEKAVSGNIIYEYKTFQFGIAGIFLNYEYPIQSQSASAFYGKSGLLKSHFGKYSSGTYAIGYEISLDAEENPAAKIATLVDLGNSEFTSHFRYFSEKFRSPNGVIFGEYSYPSNEMGLYLGFMYKGIKGVKIHNYIDIFKSIGRTYYIDGSVFGFGVFNQTEFHLDKRLDYLTRLKYDNKTDEEKIESKDIKFQKQRIFWRNELQYSVSKSLRARVRLETSYINFSKVIPSETGLAGFVELHYDFNNIELIGRASVFSTPSYESAIWQYEYFIPGNLSVFSAYSDGSRLVLGSKFELFEMLHFQFLYINTSKNNLESLSSGNDKILNNSSNNFILQIELKIK
jgi:hypothetical protein